WGPALPLYGVRSHRNWGAGDLTDLGQLVDLCAEAGAGLVALPPLHALKGLDPFFPQSRQFFHPLALDVEAIPDFAESGEARALVANPEFQARLRALMDAEHLDAGRIEEVRRPVLECLYRHFREHHLHPGDREGRAFAAFREEGGEALYRFALYRVLERLRPEGWPEAFRSPEDPAVSAFARNHEEDIDFERYLQWRLEQQLSEVGRRCWERGLGIGLQLGFAAGVEEGAETWSYPDIYPKGVRAGLPPSPEHPGGEDLGWCPPSPLGLQKSAYAPFIAALRRNMRFAGALCLDRASGLARQFWFPEEGGPREGAWVRYPLEALLGILALESQRQHCLVIMEGLPEAVIEPYGILERRLFIETRDAEENFLTPSSHPPLAEVCLRDERFPPLAGFWKGRDLELRRRLGLYADERHWQAAVIRRAEDRARLLVALEREGLLPEGMGIDPVFVGAMDDELVRGVIALLARTAAKAMAFHMEDLFLCTEPTFLPSADYPSWHQRLPVPLEGWGEDPRWQGATEMLRAERGTAVLPPKPVPSPKTRIPRATYRLQFNRQFTFRDAEEQVPYLHGLGISHCYASPYLKARPGSTHGYDIIDHCALNPEIGTPQDYDAWVGSLLERGMGQILDTVPNHMGVMGCDNAWWLDVLENGQASLYADYFDIDWHPVTEALRGKMLVPVLGDHYGTVLARGELKLTFDEGAFTIRYYEHCFPLDPQTYPHILGYGLELLTARLGEDDPALMEFQSLISAFGHLPPHSEGRRALREERHRDEEVHKKHLAALCQASPAIQEFIEANVVAIGGIEGEPRSFDFLHSLLEKQPYRLAYWRVAADEINYRRFFDINDLAGLRQENPEVFEATHRFIFELIASGKVHGLRIDHPDGLYAPAAYYQSLQQNVCTIAGDGDGELPCYLVIEKILAGYEQLRPWPVHGTTGYEFANLVNGLFVYAEAEREMDRAYQRFIGHRLDFDEVLYASKKLIIRGALSSEMTVLANLLDRLTESDPHTRDFTLNGLRDALTEVVACFPVYRTYVTGEEYTEEDRRFVEWAVAQAKKRRASGEVSIFDFIRDILLLDGIAEKDAAYRAQAVRFAMKFQQYTAPVMAKGMEDTAFYRYHRLISLNEVGGDPRRFGVSLAAFHHANAMRARHWPHAMLTLSTHDTKRSADVRARINVLSELPGEWRQAVARWGRINRSRRRSTDGTAIPSRNDEYLLYQTLVGAFPPGGLGEVELGVFTERIEQYMLKAIKEAKEHTSWINPDQAYEEGVTHFVRAILDPRGPFLDDFLPFQRRIAHFGYLNSLAQVLLHLTAPGVPDIYQGDELWNFSLVDPDNRRPVDYSLRRRLLEEIREAAPAALLGNLEDGRIKLFVIWKTLSLRAQDPLLFQEGDYLPLHAEGAKADHLCAFARRRGDRWCIAAVPRWTARLLGREDLPLGEVWEDTALILPEPLRIEHAFTGEVLEGDRLKARELFARFPVALCFS
ncbi:MAG: malto-oligosyltrehalose synthase, partial [Gammaproteobacteria bacterium]